MVRKWDCSWELLLQDNLSASFYLQSYLTFTFCAMVYSSFVNVKQLDRLISCLHSVPNLTLILVMLNWYH